MKATDEDFWEKTNREIDELTLPLKNEELTTKLKTTLKKVMEHLKALSEKAQSIGQDPTVVVGKLSGRNYEVRYDMEHEK